LSDIKLSGEPLQRGSPLAAWRTRPLPWWTPIKYKQ